MKQLHKHTDRLIYLKGAMPEVRLTVTEQQRLALRPVGLPKSMSERQQERLKYPPDPSLTNTHMETHTNHLNIHTCN